MIKYRLIEKTIDIDIESRYIETRNAIYRFFRYTICLIRGEKKTGNRSLFFHVKIVPHSDSTSNDHAQERLLWFKRPILCLHSCRCFGGKLFLYVGSAVKVRMQISFSLFHLEGEQILRAKERKQTQKKRHNTGERSLETICARTTRRQDQI